MTHSAYGSITATTGLAAAATTPAYHRRRLNTTMSNGVSGDRFRLLRQRDRERL
jgi:membrane associated rhomboid family serine protease